MGLAAKVFDIAGLAPAPLPALWRGDERGAKSIADPTNYYSERIDIMLTALYKAIL
jgi:hypothetical protein